MEMGHPFYAADILLLFSNSPDIWLSATLMRQPDDGGWGIKPVLTLGLNEKEKSVDRDTR